MSADGRYSLDEALHGRGSDRCQFLGRDGCSGACLQKVRKDGTDGCSAKACRQGMKRVFERTIACPPVVRLYSFTAAYMY